MNEKGPRYGVYAFYRNHETQLLNFLKHIKDADEIVLCDAGSEDGSPSVVESFMKENPKVNIKNVRAFVSPWRYDDIRNIGLSLMSRSIDLCLCLDVGESLVPEWRAILDAYYDAETSLYQYYVQVEKGGADEIILESRIHKNGGCFWKYPVYEELIIHNGQNTKKIPRILLTRAYQAPEHDTIKLLERYIKEEPSRWIPFWRLAEVLHHRGSLVEAHQSVEAALKLDGCDKSKLYALKARIYMAEGNLDDALNYLSKAIIQSNDTPDWQLYVEKARILSGLGRHMEAYIHLKEAKVIQHRLKDEAPLVWRGYGRIDDFLAMEKKLALEEITHEQI